MTGIQAFLDVLAAAGATHLFGNPGTTELPLQDALAADPRFRYFFGVHEVPVMAMADGYALASRRLAVVNLHIGCGLGNAMGMLYNAHVEGTPLLVTAGQQDRRLRFDEPVLAADLVRVARPWTKWAAEVQRAVDVPNAVRRAIQAALTPPTGPVFLSLPVDLQMEESTGLDVRAPYVPAPARPASEDIERAAQALLQARNPGIVAGSRVLEAGGAETLGRLADLLGAPIFGEAATMHGRLPVRPDHPLYQGPLPLWAPDIAATLSGFDVVFVAGANFLRLYIYLEPASPIPRSTRIIHLDSHPEEVGKNYPVEVGLIGDPAAGLSALVDCLKDRIDRAAAQGRANRWSEQKKTLQQKLRGQLEEHAADRPMTSWTMMRALADRLPANIAVVEESLTSHHGVLEQLAVVRDADALFAHRGWALGWGMGCALGVKLAWPNRPVVALIGDGSALYGAQALWSAAHHQIPVTFIICKNRQYKILRNCGTVMNLPRLAQPGCPGMDLVQPEVDYLALAQAFGVKATRVSESAALSDVLSESLKGSEPRLIEAVLADE